MDIGNNKCFNHIVGITKRKCTCTEDKPKNWNKSLSGLYLDDATYGVPLHKKKYCWDDLEIMRDDAIQQGKDLFRRNIGSPNISTFNGTIGAKPRRHKNVLTNRYVGFMIKPKSKYKGLVFRLKSLKFSVDIPGTYTVYINTIHNLRHGNILSSPYIFDIQTSGDSTETMIDLSTIDLKLECNGDCQNWAFVLDLEEIDSKVQAKPVKYDYWEGCQSCSSKKPFWWDRQLSSGGFNLSDITDIDEYCTGKTTGGLLAEFQVVCDCFAWVCDMDDYFWKNDTFGYNFALGVKMLWALNYLERCESDPDYFDATSLKSANWLALHKQKLIRLVYGDEQNEGHFEGMANPELMPKNISDCWTCKSSQSPFKHKKLRYVL